MRQIEEWAQVLARLTGLRREGSIREAEDMVKDLLKQTGPGADPDRAKPEDFIDAMEAAAPLEADYLVLLGNALWEHWVLTIENPEISDEEVDENAVKALHVLISALLADTSVYRITEIGRIKDLISVLENVNLPERTAAQVAAFEKSFG